MFGYFSGDTKDTKSSEDTTAGKPDNVESESVVVG